MGVGFVLSIVEQTLLIAIAAKRKHPGKESSGCV